VRHGRGGAGGRLAVLAALLGAAACGSGGKADQELERVASWSATARLVAEQRASGVLSARYAGNALHAAHAELARSARSLRAALDSSSDSTTLSPADRARAIAAAVSVERTVAHMARLADSRPDDRALLLGAAAGLDPAGRLARALADSARGGG
jgi:hypothetical protein